MKKSALPLDPLLDTLPLLPAWVTEKQRKSPETDPFLAGASLMLLHSVLADPAEIVPTGLLRNRLALRATEACLKFEGRRESEADIRDAYYLARAGDDKGPAGEMYVRWRKVSAIGLKRADWLARLKTCVPEQVAENLPEWIDAAMAGGPVANGSPMAQAAEMIEMVMAAFPREEASALICGDLVLARALGWAHPEPLLGVHMKRGDLRLAAEATSLAREGRRDDLVIACHRAVAQGAQDAVRLAHDLARRAQRLRAVAPKLRARGSGEAVALFLGEDAVMPSTMLTRGTSIAMTDRAARRFCDRLVELGVVKELTGRATFRLYGVA